MKNQIVLKSFDELSQFAAPNQAPSHGDKSVSDTRSNKDRGSTEASPYREREKLPTGWRGCPAEAEAWSG
jgi:hypothetical protein